MNFLREIYNQKLAENSKNIRYWEDYVNNLKSLDFSVFADKLKVPALIPIGSRVMFRGELKHTNEVTVALGADYFAKCSLKQAEVLRQHRIKDAQSKLEIFLKEKEFLENQVSLKKETVQEKKAEEIVEFQTEEEDLAWREKHKENMRIYKQNICKKPTASNDTSDKELWERLEELELQEELENEFLSMKEDSLENESINNIFKDTFMEVITDRKSSERDLKREHSPENTGQVQSNANVTTITETYAKIADNIQIDASSKLQLLQRVIDKQNELGEKLQALRNKDNGKSSTEIDLVRKLEEMEELDELEDEMDRLEDMLDGEEYVTIEEDPDTRPSKINVSRKVSFADEQEDETLELQFNHSHVESCKDPYDPNKGIQKPSDIYVAFSHLFSETTSILKKAKYDPVKVSTNVPTFRSTPTISEEDSLVECGPVYEINKTINVRDVVERTNANDITLESKSRPTSLFKMRRQQKK